MQEAVVWSSVVSFSETIRGSAITIRGDFTQGTGAGMMPATS